MRKIIFEDKEYTPSKVVCVGRNFVEHIYELGNEIPSEMVLFNKGNNSITDTLFHISQDLHFEGELSFLVKDKKLLAIGLGLDLTKREVQSFLKSKSLSWERAKSFDNAAVFSHFIPVDFPLKSLKFEIYINDELRQFGNYELMIYKPEEILQEILTFQSLEDGDIIMSGTPKGVNSFQKGDEFIGKIYSNEKLLLEKKWIAK